MKFFKCMDGTIFSIKDIVSIKPEGGGGWKVDLNVYDNHDHFGFVRGDIFITQGDYERLVGVMGDEGLLR